MDHYFFISSSTCQNHTHLLWRSTQTYHTTDTHSYTQIKASMQCHITAFHLPPRYVSHDVSINISLNTANLNVANISAPRFRIWQHLEVHWNRTSLQHLANIPSVPLDKIYKQMITSNWPMNPFLSTDESTGETVTDWTLFSHAGVYVMAMELLITAGLGIFFCYFFWCQPARLACWPLQSGSMWYTIVDDNVKAVPIYRCDSKAEQPIVRPHKNYDLHVGELTEATDFVQSISCIWSIE